VTTTIRASVLMDGTGPGWPSGAWDGVFTVLHVVVVAVSVLSGLLAMAAAGKLGFDAARGTRRCYAEGCWEEPAAGLGMVVFLVTGISNAAWAAGPGVGLLILAAATGLVVAVNWFMVWRERRTTAALLTAVCGQSGGEQS
jgi:hypothetical protein